MIEELKNIVKSAEPTGPGLYVVPIDVCRVIVKKNMAAYKLIKKQISNAEDTKELFEKNMTRWILNFLVYPTEAEWALVLEEFDLETQVLEFILAIHRGDLNALKKKLMTD